MFKQFKTAYLYLKCPRYFSIRIQTEKNLNYTLM